MKPAKFLLKARHSGRAFRATADARRSGRMRLGVDIEMQHVALLPQVVRVVNSVPSVIFTVTE